MIKFDKNPGQVELFKAVGSKNQLESMKAQEMLAAFLNKVALEVLQKAGTASLIYEDLAYDEDDDPSIPLDLYYDQNEAGYVSVWSQSIAGGLPTSQDISTIQEMKVSPYTLSSAISLNKKYARKARLDVIAKYLERHLQEILIKQERNAWAVVMKALAEAATNTERRLGEGLGQTSTLSTSYGDSSLKHVIRSNAAGTFQIADMNDLMTRIKRVNSDWNGGTPINAFSNGITDMFVSPEVKGDIRAFAYNPMSTVGANQQAANTSNSDNPGVALPDSMREEIFRNAGMQALFGVNIIDLNELGVGQKYNTLFDTFAGSTSYTKGDGTSGTTFDGANDEIIVGVDNTKGCFVRPVATAEGGGTVNVEVDDVFTKRQDKFGWYSHTEESRVCTDARATVGILLG